MALSFTVPAFAVEGTEVEPSKIMIPDMLTYYDSIEEELEAEKQENQAIDPVPTPRGGIYVYLNNKTAYKTDMQEVPKLSRISGTMITIPSGTTATYVKGVNGSTTVQHQFNISAQAQFDVNVVSAEVKGSYQYTNTATTSTSEQWSVTMDTAGTYKITWYMIGHKYTVNGQCRVASTDSGDGRITYARLGTVTYPTTEKHMVVTRT